MGGHSFEQKLEFENLPSETALNIELSASFIH